MIIRDYIDGDETEILKLFNLSFGKEMPIEYWNWRFKQNPLNKIQIKLMFEEDKMIGHYAVSPVEFIHHSNSFQGALSMTTMTHPDYNGKGIFTKLATALYEDLYANKKLDMVYGFPNSNSHYGFITKLKWKNLTLIPVCSANFKFDNHQKNELTKINTFESRHEIAFNEITANFTSKLNRSSDWYNWRYISNPINKYICLELKHENNLNFAIAKLFHINNKLEIDICDFICQPDPNLVLKFLIGIYREANTSQEIKFNIWLPLESTLYPIFEKFGFKPGIPLTYSGYNFIQSNQEINPNHWYFSMGDSDIF